MLLPMLEYLVEAVCSLARVCTRTHNVLLNLVRFMAKILFKRNQMKTYSEHTYVKRMGASAERQKRELCRKFVIDFYLHFGMFIYFDFGSLCSHVCFVRQGLTWMTKPIYEFALLVLLHTD